MNEADAIGFRMVYRDLVLSRSLTTIFRPDSPKYEKLYKESSTIEDRIIRYPGNQQENVEPIFTPERVWLRVKSIKKLKISELKADDFAGSSPDVQGIQGLVFHLGMIYNKPAEEFTPDTIITKIEVEYV